MKKTAVFLLSALLVACSADQSADGAAAPTGGMPPSAVSTAMPVAGSMDEILTIAGSLTANRSALISAEATGIIESVGIKDGQVVKKDDVLFIIEHKTQAAELKRAQANVSLREQEYKRAQSLFKRNSVSQYDVDKANAELLTAQADLDFAQAQLDKARVVAPFDASVGIRQVNKGSYVQTGTPLIELVALNPLYLDFSAPETVLSMLKVGDELTATIPALRKDVIAQVIAIEPFVSAATRSIKLRASVNNDQGELRPGLFARVALPISTEENVLWLPESAVFYNDSQKFVMINNDGKSLRKEVKIAGFENGRVAIILGLDVSDEVVIAGHHKMPFDGMPMMVVPATEQTAPVAQ